MHPASKNLGGVTLVDRVCPAERGYRLREMGWVPRQGGVFFFFFFFFTPGGWGATAGGLLGGEKCPAPPWQAAV